MTIGAAWVRTVGSISELIVVSDSRLSGGQSWDANAKIMLLPRTDAVLSFSGETNDAYPLMLQAYNTIEMYPPAKSRAMDITDLKGHLIRVFDHTRSFISNFPHGQTSPANPEAIFVFCGYSWKAKEFKIWKLHYDPTIKKFTFRPSIGWSGQGKASKRRIGFFGDKHVISDLRKEIADTLRKKEKLQGLTFDMEPFEAVRNLIRSGKYSSIGGALQMVKIYSHGNTVPVGVFWPNKSSGKICVFGRPLMDYEKIPWGVIDPDNPSRVYDLEDIPQDLNCNSFSSI